MQQPRIAQQDLVAATNSLQKGLGPLAGLSPSITGAATWTNITISVGTGPSPRAYSGLVYDGADSYVVLFGGPPPCCTLGETWKFSHGSWTNIAPSSAPSGRQSFGMAYDVADGYVLLFGGFNPQQSDLADTWKFSKGSWTNITSPGPSARQGSAMAYDASDGYILLFGGSNPMGRLLGDTWKFSAGSWTNITSSVGSGPAPRTYSDLVYDAADGYLVLFGGGASDTWKFSGGLWTNISSGTAPAARFLPSMTYDAAEGYVVLFGGNVVLSDTWKFSGGSWTNITSPGPSARQGSAMAYDASDRYVVLFGGVTPTTPPLIFFGDTWRFSTASVKSDSPPTVSFTEDRTSASVGQAITLTITSSDSDGTVQSVDVFWGDGTHDPFTSPLASITDTHSYSMAGTFHLEVDGIDNVGLTSSSSSTKTVTDVPPVVSFRMDKSSASTGQPITLTISSSDSDGSVSSVDVFWGDGTHDPFPSPAATVTDTHSYSTSGTFTITVDATDNANLIASSSSTVTITDVPPAVSFTVDKTSATTGELVTLTISSSDADGKVSSVDVFWGDGTHHTFPSPTATVTDSHSYTTAGSPSIDVEATDNAGLTVSTSRTITITDVPPHVKFTADKTTAATGQMITLTISSSDSDGTVQFVDVFWGDGTHHPFTSPLATITDAHSYMTAGIFTISVDATDNANLAVTNSSEVIITDAPPIVSFTADKSTVSTGGTVSLTISSSDPGGTVQSLDVFWGDGTHTPFTSPGPTTTTSHAYSTAGTFTIEADATDNAGLTASSRSEEIVTDAPPHVSFTEDRTTATVGQVITLTITSSDSDGTIASIDVSWGEGPIQTFTSPGASITATHSYSTAGTFTVQVDAHDDAGLFSSSLATKTIAGGIDVPPTVSFTADKTAAAVGATITLTISSADSDGTVSSVSINWGDGTIDPRPNPLASITATHSYTTIGTYRVSVTATDNANLNTETISPIIITDIPPTVSFTADKTAAKTGETITVTVSSSDSDGTVTSLDIFWGDGGHDAFPTPASSITASHSFTTAGIYRPSATATDNGGATSEVVSSVVITDQPPVVGFTQDKTTAPTGGLITLVISSSDPDGTVASLTVYWGDGNSSPVSSPGASVTLTHSYSTQGFFHITATVTDNAGLSSDAVSLVIITDIPPTISFTTDKTTANTGQTFTLTIASSDPDGTVTRVDVYWGDGNHDTFPTPAASITATHSYSSVGTFHISADATDNAGLGATAVSPVIITDQPPTVSFTVDKSSTATGQTITFTITSSDPDGTVASMSIFWGDGTSMTGITNPAGTVTQTHAYSTQGTFTPSVDVLDNTGLAASYNSPVIITDKPPVVSFTEDKTTAIKGQRITLTITSSDADGTVQSLFIYWGDGSPPQTINTPRPTTTVSHAYLLAGTFTVSITATDNAGLTGDAGSTKTITDAPPTVSFTEDKTTAPTGAMITLTITSADSDGTVTSIMVAWDDGKVDTLPGTATTDTHSYTTAGTYTVTVTATDDAGLSTSATATKTITAPVNMPPTVNFTEDKTTANTGETITLTISATDPDDTVATITVDWGDGTIHTLPGIATSDTHAYANTGNAKTQTFTVTVTATDSRGAVSTAVHAIKTINDLPPVAKFTESTTSTTTGISITFDASGSTDPDGTISTYAWNLGDGTASTGLTTAHSYSSPSPTGGYTVTLTVTDNSGNSATATSTKTITPAVDEPPTVSFTEDLTAANTGQTITLTIASADTDGTISQTVVDWGDGTVHTLTGAATSDTHAYANTGSAKSAAFTVKVTVTDSSSLTATASAVKTINDLPPVAKFTETLTSTTTGTSISFDASTSTDPDGAIVTYAWSFGDGTTGSGVNPSHTYSTPSPTGGYTVTLTVTDNSGNTAQATSIKTITVPTNQPPTVTFTEDKTTANTGDAITVTISASDPDDIVASITVDWGDGTIHTLPGTATSDTHAYANTGNSKSQSFTVTVTATDSRGATSLAVHATKVINDRVPVAKFSESKTSTTTGTSISFDAAASIDPDGTISGYTWTFGDGTTGTGVTTTHSYATASPAGGYTVTLTVTDNSGNAATTSTIKTITSPVNVPPVAKFTESTTVALTGVLISFDASTSNDPDGGTIVSYAWDFGDGTIGAGVTITHSYGRASPPAGYTVTLTVTDSDGGNTGTATATKTIQDRPPLAMFTESTSLTTTGTSISFNAVESADPDGTITSYSWNFGDGTTATGVTTSHTYSSPSPAGRYAVTLTVTDNSGSTGHATATKTITAPGNLPPTVSFTEDKTTANTGDKITLTITASDPDDTIASITVDWGDGTAVDTLPGTATSDSHGYASTGNAKTQTFTVSVTATDSRGATGTPVTASKTINDRPPTVSFTESTSIICGGGSITLTITSSDPDGTIASLKVSWGDGTIDTLPGTATSDSHTYAVGGSFNVYVNATDNSGSTTKSSVATKTVVERPCTTVSFTESTTEAPTGTPIALTITASSISGTITSFKVSWGDGTIDSIPGTSTTDSHEYSLTGNSKTATYLVYVNATDSVGTTSKSGTATKTITDRPPIAAFTFTPTSPFAGQGVSFDASTSTDPDGTITSYSWSFGDGSTGTGATPSHIYNTPGTFLATLTVTDNSGFTGTATNQVIVTSPVAAATLSFKVHDCDDYEHGVGQLDVLANGDLIVNIPAGLFHLAGSGDYTPYKDRWVQLGPFNIVGLVQGQNTLVFRNPLDSHECSVKNVVVGSGQTTLLNYTKTFEVEPEEPVKLTFSNPPLVLTSFTETSKIVAQGESFAFNATFTGGTGPFTCSFQFGDHNSKTVTTTSHTCTTTHTYGEIGTFRVTVKIRGASTSDRATGTLQIQVHHKPHPVQDDDDDIAAKEEHHHKDWD